VLREEYLKPLGLSARALAAAISVPANRLTEIVRERRSITADTAIRLGKYFNTDALLWINLQVAHDLSKAQADLWGDVESGRLKLPIDRTFPLEQAAAALAHMRANQHFGKIVLVA